MGIPTRYFNSTNVSSLHPTEKSEARYHVPSISRHVNMVAVTLQTEGWINKRQTIRLTFITIVLRRRKVCFQKLWNGKNIITLQRRRPMGVIADKIIMSIQEFCWLKHATDTPAASPKLKENNSANWKKPPSQEGHLKGMRPVEELITRWLIIIFKIWMSTVWFTSSSLMVTYTGQERTRGGRERKTKKSKKKEQKTKSKKKCQKLIKKNGI